MGGATRWSEARESINWVSMPHAALWVVQPYLWWSIWTCRWCFNAARGFVGGATTNVPNTSAASFGFNAARGFVGGATASLAALVPLRGKSPFGKSPEI